MQQQQRTHAVTFAAEIILSEFRRPGQKTGLNPFTALLGKDLYMRGLSLRRTHPLLLPASYFSTRSGP
jgi:hypothetical protein